HEVEVGTVVLLRAGQVPRTSSGKIQRRRCRELFLANELEAVANWTSTAPSPESLTLSVSDAAPALPGEEQIQDWLIGRISHRLRVKPSLIDIQSPFASLGLNSVAAVQIASEMEVFLGQPVSPTLVYDYPSIEKLARHLAGVRQASGLDTLSAERWEEP